MTAKRGDFSSPAAPRPAMLDGVFRQRTVAWLIGISGASLAAALIALAFSGQMRAGDSEQANAFSRSSIGYRALVELLDGSGVNVVVSRFRSAHKAGPSAPLLIAEPIYIAPRAGGDSDPRPERPDDEEDGAPLGSRTRARSGAGDSRSQGLADVVAIAEARGAPVVVVLPKWYGDTNPQREGWIGALDERASDAEQALAALAIDRCGLVWPEAAGGGWESSLPGGERPTLPEPQLLDLDCELDPIVSSPDGILIGQLPGRRALVVSDPDLLNTYGLAHGDNAVIAHRLLVDRLGASSLVIDEVLHGFYQPPSIWTELLTLPLLPVTLHVLALTALAIAAAATRFGRPEPSPPRVPPGKRALVDSTAELLDGGGHHAESLRHYLRMTLRHTAAAVGAPLTAGEDPVAALASLARSRGVRSDITAIARRIEALGGAGADEAPPSLRGGGEGPASLRGGSLEGPASLRGGALGAPRNAPGSTLGASG
ncbi:MAG: hypothetical protein IT372_01405, partial [Polyangiaceae bacterium]|nr:hypothetical protein [Polyangiaceae bacterium]